MGEEEEKDKVRNILREMQDKLRQDWEEAKEFLRTGDSKSRRRNELAEQATNNNLNDANRILHEYTGNTRNTKEALIALRVELGGMIRHCEYRSNQFSEYAKKRLHDNGYAAHCHGKARDIFERAKELLLEVGDEASARTTPKLPPPS